MVSTSAHFRTAAFGALAFAAISPAVAQTAIANSAVTTAEESGEIIVTAQRRSERAVDVPISVTALSPAQLTTANVQQLSDIVRITPALRFDNQAAFAQPSIRGIGTSVTTSGGGANVGIYIDGFYSPNPLAADFSLLKTEGIQVLKGPQGTLFGRNTTGGAILIQTADPSFTPSAEARVSYGRFNQWRGQAYVTSKLTDTIAFDLEGQIRTGDGWVRNIISGSDRDGKYENWSIRAGLKFQISDNVSLLVRYTHNDIDDPTSMLTNTYVDPILGATAPNFAPPSTFTTDKNLYAGTNPRFFRSKNDAIQATLKADLGFGDLTSYTQYRTENSDISQDLDQTALTVFQIGLPIDNETFSQELLLNSKPGGRLQWTAGLFYFQNRDTYTTFIDNNVATTGRFALGGSSTTPKSFAAFADLTYALTPQLFLTLGGRFAHDKIDDAYFIAAFSGVRTPVTQAQSDAVSQNRFTPRVVLRYQPNDNSSLYASFTQGYKAALLDVGGSTGNPVNPEKVNAFEIGYKYSDNGLSFDTAAFYYDYKDLQVSLFKGNPPSAQIVNAAKSEIYGIEAQASYFVANSFKINAGAAWVHARYNRFNDAPVYARCPGIGGCGGGTSFFLLQGITLTDTPMTRTPEFTANVGASYDIDLAGGDLALSGNFYYSSSFNFGPSGSQFPQEAFATLALRAQWTDPSDRFTFAVWGDNVTNSRFLTQVQYNNFGIGSVWNSPAVYGVEVGVKF